jgi:hypothetical protein
VVPESEGLGGSACWDWLEREVADARDDNGGLFNLDRLDAEAERDSGSLKRDLDAAADGVGVEGSVKPGS